MTATILAAFLPVFAVIAAGYAVRASNYLPREFWRGVNALNHRLLLPAFLFMLLATADFSHPEAGRLALLSAAGTAALLAISGLVCVLARFKPGPGAAVGAVAVQWNFVLTLALVTRLAGPDAAPLAAAVVASGVILGAAFTVAGFALAGGAGLAAALQRMARDPLVLAGLLGLAASAAGLARFEPLLAPVQLIGAGALPVILLAMGAGLDFAALKGRLAPLLTGAALRCLAGPLVFLGLALTFHVSGNGALVLAIAGAAPSAAFVYAVAADFETETGLTAGMITLTVLVSAAISPLATAIALSL